MEMINKHTVLKAVRDKGQWTGIIAPNKAMPGGPWNIGMDITIVNGRDNKPYVISYNAEDYEELETYLNSFMYYNCNSELGHRVRFWED